jgi:GntR family transcriptional regulator of arabinose operon
MLDLLTAEIPKKVQRETVFNRLKCDLLTLIDQGRIAPGELIPPENILAEKYNISRSSVRQALKDLEVVGKIFKRPGKGTFVKDITNDTSQHSIDTKSIGIDIELPSSGEDWYCSKLFHGIEEVCAEHYCRVALFRKFRVEKVKKGFVDGLISTGAYENEYDMYERLAMLEIYPVLINRITEHEHIAYFSVNYRRESEKAAKRFLEKGHRKIGIITAGTDNIANKARYLGFCDAAAKYSSAVHHEMCDMIPFQTNELYVDIIYKYLKDTKVSAIYLLNGCFAIPLFVAIQRLGLKVPDDLEIMCFDDIEYTFSLYHYPFYYVKMPLFEMGRDAAEYLIRKFAEGRDCPVVKKIYVAELVSAGY